MNKEGILNPAILFQNVSTRYGLKRAWEGHSITTGVLASRLKKTEQWARGITSARIASSIRTLGCFHLEKGVVTPTTVTTVLSPEKVTRCFTCQAKEILGHCPVPTSVVPANSRPKGHNVFTRPSNIPLSERFMQRPVHNWMKSINLEDRVDRGIRDHFYHLGRVRAQAEADFRWPKINRRTKPLKTRHWTE